MRTNNNRPNVVIHYGASQWTAHVRGANGDMIEFDIRAMDRREQHNFRRELVKAFRESRAEG